MPFRIEQGAFSVVLILALLPSKKDSFGGCKEYCLTLKEPFNTRRSKQIQTSTSQNYFLDFKLHRIGQQNSPQAYFYSFLAKINKNATSLDFQFFLGTSFVTQKIQKSDEIL